MPELPKKLQAKLSIRATDNTLRRLFSDSNLIDFSSNDYLGFAKETSIHNSTLKSLSDSDQIKNGASGSRLLSGNHPLYEKLEIKLTEMFGSESALVFNSGYDANIGFFSSVPQRGDVVFYDELIHASIRDGIKIGFAKSYKFKHNDIIDLRSKFQAEQSRRPKDAEVYIVTESVFSMDGDSPGLKSFAEFCADNQCQLVVDEAHAIGVSGKNGKGLIQDLGLENQIFARIITFGKALGCHGAAILGSKDLTNYLINFARSFIYTTALPPNSIATIISALEFLNSARGEERRHELIKNIDFFKGQIEKNGLLDKFLLSDSAIHCCLVSGNNEVKSIAERLHENGFDVKPILSPTVPEGQERLRFGLHSYNSEEEIASCLSILAKFSRL